MTGPVGLLPDVVALSRAWLVTQTDVTDLVATRVQSRRDREPVFPYVQLDRIGGRPLKPNHIDLARIQFVAYADPDTDGTLLVDQEELASLVARTVMAALLRAPYSQGALAEGVISNVDIVQGLAWHPDVLLDPPTPALMFVAEVTAHPVPA